MSTGCAPLDPTPHEAHPGFARLLVCVPPRIRDAFSRDQVEAPALTTVAVETSHIVAERRTLGFLGSHYCFALFLGRCRRHRPTRLERFIHRGLKRSREYRALKYLLLSAFAAAGVVALVLGLYVLKSSLGIDLVVGPSVLHDIVY